MERRLSPAAFAVSALVMTLSLLGAAVVAPQNDYYRWQELDHGTTRKADWIYERLHFDAEPIDVALIGTSRTGGGLSGPDIEAAYCAATGRRIRVANLSIPETGRNIHYVIAKEAMRAKRPALTVIELNEIEARRQHRGFVALADVEDIVTAPIIANLNYFPDLARLPGRQAVLWFRTLTGRGAVKSKFDPAAYQGHDLDRTRALPLLDGTVVSRYTAAPRDELDAGRASRTEARAGMRRVPSAIRKFEHRVPRYYLRKIETLAAENDRKIDYAFLPAWGEGALPRALTDDLGVTAPVIDLGGRIAEDPGKWLDATHVNAWGAAELSSRFAAELVRRHPALGEKGCART
ncbi:MAG: hypothetical protein HXY21_09710 [Parvularculaceae bacterium]|nr:hypothetical protein [Parvularculaceae bacterium]